MARYQASASKAGQTTTSSPGVSPSSRPAESQTSEGIEKIAASSHLIPLLQSLKMLGLRTEMLMSESIRRLK